MIPAPASASLDHAVLKEILLREHSRNLEDGFLAATAQDADAAVRARAYRALGRIQDPASLSILEAGSEDPDAAVRREAVFALGQLEIPEAVPALNRAIKDADAAVRRLAVEGLGKCNDADVVPRLAEILSGEDEDLAAAAATALGYAAVRGIKIYKEAREALRNAVTHSNDEIVWRACFAVQRGKVKHVIFQDRFLLDHENPLVRMYGLKAMAATSTRNRQDAILPCLKDEDWRVRVEALGALARSKDRTLVGRMSLYLDDPNPNVQVAAARSLTTLAYSEGVNRFADWRLSSDWRLRGEFLRNKTRSSGAGTLGELREASKDPNWRLRVLAAECMGEIGNNQAVITLEPMVTDENPSVQAAAINALVEFDEEAATKAIRPGLKSADPIVIMTAANGAGQRLDRDALPLLLDAYQPLQSPFDTEAMTAILEAVGTVLTARDEDGAIGSIKDEDRARAVALLTEALEDPDVNVAARAAESLALVRGEPPLEVHRPPVLPSTFDADLAAELELSESPITAVVETRSGSITLELLPQVAPGTVANFINLAREGFYDGLLFHRVVPNFVIQGGDPRGDGWGGPDYTIACEYSPESYDTGAVGMAHSGKDTAGSQFFITHAPMPHLNGRYTLFGRLIAGQEAVDNIQVGDTIQSIRIEGF